MRLLHIVYFSNRNTHCNDKFLAVVAHKILKFLLLTVWFRSDSI